MMHVLTGALVCVLVSPLRRGVVVLFTGVTAVDLFHIFTWALVCMLGFELESLPRSFLTRVSCVCVCLRMVGGAWCVG